MDEEELRRRLSNKDIIRSWKYIPLTASEIARVAADLKERMYLDLKRYYDESDSSYAKRKERHKEIAKKAYYAACIAAYDSAKAEHSKDSWQTVQ